MAARTPLELGRRERQIMEIVYRLGEVSVAGVRGAMEDPPSYSAVRAMLNWLEGKKLLKRRDEGKRHLYRPTAPRERVRGGALRRLVETFFDGSVEEAVASLLEDRGRLGEADLDRLAKLIEQARSAKPAAARANKARPGKAAPGEEGVS